MLTDDVTGIEAPRQSPAIDVFATASVLFELACARLPFGEKGAMPASPYRLKAEGAPAPAVMAHANAATLDAVLSREPDVAAAVADALRGLPEPPSAEKVSHDLGRVDAQLARALALVLFVAAGCSGSAAAAVDYLLEWEWNSFGAGCPTPASAALDGCGDAASAGVTPCLGLVRVCEGYVMGQPHWVDPAGAGCVVGSLATDDSGLCNVEADVSSRHLRVWFADGAWWASDLGSANGSWLRPASGPSEVRLEPGERHALAPGDELRLGAFTRFVLLEGLPG